jgi:hypothetical protein
MTTHTFILLYHPDAIGGHQARRAINRWYIQGLFDQSLWSAFYDRVQLRAARRGEVIAQVAYLDREEG